MSRTRLSRRRMRLSVLGEIENMERVLTADADEVADGAAGKKIRDEAEDIAKEESGIAEESTGYKVVQDPEQNEKAMDNWPVSAAEGRRIASRLVSLAKKLLED